MSAAKLTQNFVFSDSGFMRFDNTSRGLADARSYAMEETNAHWFRTWEVPNDTWAAVGRLIPHAQQGVEQLTQQPKYPSFGRNDLKDVKMGLNEAKKLAKKKQCDEALKSYGIDSTSKLLEGVIVEGNDANTFDGRTSSLTFLENGKTKTVADYFKEKKADVGAAVFWNMGRSGENVMFIGDYYFDPPEMENLAFQRAFIIMHEVVHLIGKKVDAQFGGSKRLSEKLINKCFPVLKGKLGGVG